MIWKSLAVFCPQSVINVQVDLVIKVHVENDRAVGVKTHQFAPVNFVPFVATAMFDKVFVSNDESQFLVAGMTTTVLAKITDTCVQTALKLRGQDVNNELVSRLAML